MEKLEPPYYIGKGCGPRMYVNHSDCGGKIPKDRRFILKIFENCSENQAFELERALIKIFGRIDIGTGCLRNLTDGGTGSSGKIITEESRKRMSIGQSRRTEYPKGLPVSEERRQAQREKMTGKPAWNKGKSWSKETRQKLSDSHMGKTSPRKGVTLSVETKRKISESLKKRNQIITTAT